MLSAAPPGVVVFFANIAVLWKPAESVLPIAAPGVKLWLLMSAAVAGVAMSIYVEAEDFLGHMFNACSTDQISEFIPEKRGFRIHGHSTTIRLEKAFWTVLEEMSERMGRPLPQLIERIHDQCLVANDKNIASCLRVICVKYMNIYA